MQPTSRNRPTRRQSRAAALAAGALALSVAGLSATATAQEGGYFAGVRFGQSGKAWSFTAPGLKLGQALEYTRGSDAANTAFTGYQFENGLALGAALNTEAGETWRRPALGLKVDGSRWADARPTVNVDVVSAFNWRNSFSVFGKLGVGRSDMRVTPEWASASAAALDRTAISYGVGVRYDITSSLGLKLELTRGTRFGLDRLRTDIDADAVNLGIRWSF